MPPAGWHDDPSGLAQLRYWDGTAWTEHVSNDGVPAVVPLPTVAPGTSVSEVSTSAVVATTHTGPTGFFASRKAAKEARAELLRVWRDALADDVITEDEERLLVEFADSHGVSLLEFAQKHPAEAEALQIAILNDGRFPAAQESSLVVRSGEHVYDEFDAALMKEQVVRELRGGSHGFSVPIGAGIRYRTGSVRARSVVVGVEMVAADVGVLAVTNRRAIFTGSKKTVEFRYDKLVGLEQYRDGLRMNVSNRQTASIFRIGWMPFYAGALIGAAVQGAD